MELIQTPDKQFTDGTRRVPGTPVPAWWLNQLQGELAAVVNEADVELDKADTQQVVKAIKQIAARQGKGILDNAPLVIYATTRVEFVSRQNTPEIQALPDGAVAVAQGYFYQRKKGSRYIPDLHGWKPIDESFGHFDGSYAETGRTSAATEYINKNGLCYNVTYIKNLKPRTLRKYYSGGVDKQSMTANLVTLRSEAAAKKYPSVLFNSDVFFTTSDLKGNTTKVQGLQVVDGEFIRNFDPGDNRDALIMMRSGWLGSIRKSDNLSEHQIKAKGVVWSAYFGPVLIENGAVISGLPDAELSSRNVIGQKSNRDIVIIQIEGKTGEYGCTIKRAAELLAEYGCIFGFNLDGGGSSQMWWKDCYSFLSSDSNFSSERAVGGIIEIQADDVGEFNTGWQPIEAADGITSADADLNIPAVCYRQKGAEIELRISIAGNFNAGYKGVFTKQRIPQRFTSVNYRDMRGALIGADLSFAAWYAGGFLSLRALDKSPYFTGNFKWSARNAFSY